MLALKIIGIIALVFLGLFLLTLIIFFFNLDVKLAAGLVPVLNWYHDKMTARRQRKEKQRKTE